MYVCTYVRMTLYVAIYLFIHSCTLQKTKYDMIYDLDAIIH